MFLMLHEIFGLLCRSYIFMIFLKSGWLKLENAIRGNWYITEYLFQCEYNIPFMHYKIAAVIGTFSELFFPLLLLLGLVSRASALVILSMIIVMSATYMHLDEHVIWGILTMNILVFGSGKISVDHFINRKLTLQK
jgi:putative oxidoreductase